MIYNIFFSIFALIIVATAQYLALRYIWNANKKQIKFFIILTQILIVLFISIKYLEEATK
jgi:hypothetical protein